MINGPRAPFRGGLPPHAYRNQMPVRPPMGPPFGPLGRSMGPLRTPGAPGAPMAQGAFRGPGGPPQMRQGGGGILSKLLNRGNQARGMGRGALQSAGRAAGAGNAGAGGFLKSLSNPGAVTGFLENTQKVLSTAQQIGPMFQQYGPLVKNIPAVWKLYRGIKSSSDEASEEKGKDNKNSGKAKKSVKAMKKEITIEKPSIQNERKAEIGNSKPKLYV